MPWVDWVTFGIALLGFGLSVYNFIKEIAKNRVSLDFMVQDIFHFSDSIQCSEIINLKVFNNSESAITLSKIEISCEDKSNIYGEYRKEMLQITSRKGKEVTGVFKWHSDILPVYIDGRSYASMMLTSTIPIETLKRKTKCRLSVHTNRGLVEKDFTFTDFSSEKLLSECRAPD